jgi:hypothetical protein
MELDPLVNSLTWVCLVQPENPMSVYILICEPYQTRIKFYTELLGTWSLSKLSYLILFCAT